MTALQVFRENLFFEEEALDRRRSIILVDIMNALGFSKNEREIHIHQMHLLNELDNIFRTFDRVMTTLTGSKSEGMYGGFYSNKSHYDIDLLFTIRDFKLYPSRTNNVNNPSPLLLHDNEDYVASFFVEEDDNFPGYVKLARA